MAELETQQEPADMMSLNDAMAKMRETAAAGNGAEIGPVLLDRLVKQIENLETEVRRLSPSADEIRYTAEQDWSGIDGAVAWHIADRHGEGWAGIGHMMESWRNAEVKRVTADLEAERDKLHARLAEIEAQEPVAWIEHELSGTGQRYLHFERRPSCLRDEVIAPVWTPLFSGPVPVQAVPDGWRLVAVEMAGKP